MNLKRLKQQEGRRVTVWPIPHIAPDGRPSKMDWFVQRVDLHEPVAELVAPSGHVLKVTPDVMHHFQHPDWWVLDVQVVIDGNEIHKLPRPWGAAARSFRRRRGAPPARTVISPPVTAAEPVRDLLAAVGVLALVHALVRR